MYKWVHSSINRTVHPKGKPKNRDWTVRPHKSTGYALSRFPPLSLPLHTYGLAAAQASLLLDSAPVPDGPPTARACAVRGWGPESHRLQLHDCLCRHLHPAGLSQSRRCILCPLHQSSCHGPASKPWRARNTFARCYSITTRTRLTEVCHGNKGQQPLHIVCTPPRGLLPQPSITTCEPAPRVGSFP